MEDFVQGRKISVGDRPVIFDVDAAEA